LADFDRNRVLRLNARRSGSGLVRCGFVARLGLLDFLAEIFHHLRGSVDDPPATRRSPQRVDFLRDVALIFRQIPCQVRELGPEKCADAADY
jgi:hypothetical protein